MSLPNNAARIGGDEFAILMPGADQKAVTSMVETIRELLNINNQFYSNTPISVSIGCASSREGETMEDMVKRADMAMYDDKRAYYAGHSSIDVLAGRPLPTEKAASTA